MQQLSVSVKVYVNDKRVRVVSRSIPPPWRSIRFRLAPRTRVRPMGVHRTCGEPDEIKKNTHPKNITALLGPPKIWVRGEDWVEPLR